MEKQCEEELGCQGSFIVKTCTFPFGDHAFRLGQEPQNCPATHRTGHDVMSSCWLTSVECDG